MTNNTIHEPLTRRREELFRHNLGVIHAQTDRLFAWLLLGQWCAAILAALWISPLTWIGAAHQTHIHVWAAVFLGGAIVSLPVFLGFRRPGAILTRHAIAVGQMLIGALLIHLTGGRIETHFHVFGSLAFLAFYRDWKVLATATAVVAADHCARGLFFPKSVFGVLNAGSWRWLEHAGWVIFEDFFLIKACGRSVKEMRTIAERQAELEHTNSGIEQIVAQRTAELREHQERFRTAFDSASIGKALVGLDGRWIQVNSALCTMVGYTEAEMMSFDFQTITHSDDVNDAVDYVKGICSGDLFTYQIEMRYIHKAGFIIWICLSASLVIDDGGKPLYFIAEILDITNRKKAESRLQIQYVVARTLADSTSVSKAAITILDAVRASMSWEMGEFWTVDEASGELRHCESSYSASSAYDEFRQLSEHYTFRPGSGLPGRVWFSESPCAAPNLSIDENFPRKVISEQAGLRSGWAFPVRSNQKFLGVLVFFARQIHSPDAECPSLTGVCEQFGQFLERKRAEEALASTSNRLKAVLESTTQTAIIAVDTQKIITVFNSGAERLLGYRAEELIGKRTLEMFHDPLEVAARVKQLESDLGRRVEGLEVFAAADRGIHAEREWTYIRKDGTRVPVSLAVTPKRDSRGQTIGHVGVAVDITNRKRQEAELQKAKESAEAANRAKSDFLANMSHEIRTPMNGIIGMTRLALESDLNPAVREYLDMVDQSAAALLTIINDILDFSKIEAGKLELDPIEFPFRDGIEDALKSLASRAQAKGLELACHILPDVPVHLVGDLGRLRQIILNLAGNAVKFTDHGEVVLRVSLEERQGMDVALHFSVSDTGIGIAPESLEKVFAPFEQADGSTTRKFGGTGLGLTISTRLVELMGGKIWVESTVGHGSTFHFTALLTVSDSPPTLTNRRSIAELEGVPVLIVDDNATNRRILLEMCQGWRMKPTCVESGAQGLAALREATAAGKKYPLMLLDAMMPQMDGFGVAEQIKNSKDLVGTPIMMLTSGTVEAARCRELGIRFYQSKPIKQSDLLDAITRVLANGDIEELKPVAGRNEDKEEIQIRPLTILLAEDYVVNQKLMIALLNKLGHTVSVVSDGGAALEMAVSNPFDLILMDLQMPVMDGLEATAAIRAHEAGGDRRIPIIALTAHAMKGDRERCISGGMDDYVSKPIQRRELLHAMSRVLPNAVRTESSGHEGQPALCKQVAAEKRSGPVEVTFTMPSCAAAPTKADALKFVDGDEELLRELAQLFLDDCPRLLSDLHMAVARSDASALRRGAHTIKGAVANFGDLKSVEAAQRLETMGVTNNLTDAASVCAALENRFNEIRPVLKDWSA